MTRLEMVEKIREKTGVTYDEARETLENNNWDLLDSIVALERERPLDGEDGAPGAQSAGSDAGEGQSAPKRVVRRAGTGELGDKVATVLRWIGSVLKKGEENRIEISRKGEEIMSVSVTTLVLFLLISWWITIILIVAGMFTGYKFKFTGSFLASRVMNTASEKAGERVEAFKNKREDERD